jgi:hypothetical protein
MWQYPGTVKLADETVAKGVRDGVQLTTVQELGTYASRTFCLAGH